MNSEPANKPNPETAFTASSPVAIGKGAEPRVTQSVTDLLTTAGHEVQSLPSRDDHGEDARLQVDGAPYTLQATGIPQAPPFWAHVSRGSATTDATLIQMVNWLDGGVEDKLAATPPAERARTIIALDAHDWADRLVSPAVITGLNDKGLNPAQRHGLAGIAIIGRNSSSSTWLSGTLI